MAIALNINNCGKKVKTSNFESNRKSINVEKLLQRASIQRDSSGINIEEYIKKMEKIAQDGSGRDSAFVLLSE